MSSIDSTNSEALAWAEQGAPEGALVVADHQTAGRGRWGRSWFSLPGASLLFSIVLRPRVEVRYAGRLTIALGVAAADGVESATGLPVTLKWPNDVMVGGRKVAGILVETRMRGSSIDFAVAGVGINVSTSLAELRRETSGRASTIEAELDRRGTGSPPRRAELLASVLAAIEATYPLIEHSEEELVERASRRSEILGKAVVVRFSGGEQAEGTVRQLTADGGLILECERGLLEVSAGEVERLRSTPA